MFSDVTSLSTLQFKGLRWEKKSLKMPILGSNLAKMLVQTLKMMVMFLSVPFDARGFLINCCYRLHIC